LGGFAHSRGNFFGGELALRGRDEGTDFFQNFARLAHAGERRQFFNLNRRPQLTSARCSENIVDDERHKKNGRND
jgi:hypothetical protein